MIDHRIPVVILCGGLGSCVGDSEVRRSKALIEVAGEPMVVHVLRLYAEFGFRTFILSAGIQVDQYEPLLVDRYGAGREADRGLYRVSLEGATCSVRVVDSGFRTGTADRIRRVREHLQDAAWFGVTYSDTLTEADLGRVAEFHHHHGRLATLLGVRMPVRFRVLGLRFDEHLVRGFAEQSVIMNDYINGGFYVFNRGVLGPDYLDCGDPVLERGVLERLAHDLQLNAFLYQGPWQPIDFEEAVPRLERIIGALRARRAG